MIELKTNKNNTLKFDSFSDFIADFDVERHQLPEDSLSTKRPRGNKPAIKFAHIKDEPNADFSHYPELKLRFYWAEFKIENSNIKDMPFSIANFKVSNSTIDKFLWIDLSMQDSQIENSTLRGNINDDLLPTKKRKVYPQHVNWKNVKFDGHFRYGNGEVKQFNLSDCEINGDGRSELFISSKLSSIDGSKFRAFKSFGFYGNIENSEIESRSFKMNPLNILSSKITTSHFSNISKTGKCVDTEILIKRLPKGDGTNDLTTRIKFSPSMCDFSGTTVSMDESDFDSDTAVIFHFPMSKGIIGLKFDDNILDMGAHRERYNLAIKEAFPFLSKILETYGEELTIEEIMKKAPHLVRFGKLIGLDVR